ncbi:Putative inactive leucine-rich repeat receptor-like protein kinase [Glycine soja]|uniref:Putative inactive leucine-rich repeat receptor-like protein kinase n=1 Tax=Glycine soja TaxID=3848 RepID=A0A0B2QS38_GLYSO|nr:Putative inactive leucine-rich repeat receptor-like protein kinase [Glycine soja]
MPGHHLHLSLFFFLISLPLTLPLNSDGLSLLAFKAAISVDPTGAVSTWADIISKNITRRNNHVTQLTLPSKALTGYLPSELGFLAHLKRLSLPHNNLSHAIPTTLFNATTLLVLDLSHNALTGPLPASLSSLKRLVRLDLSSNLLSGHLPVTLSNLPSLAGTLNLSHNRFTGNIPSSLGSLPVTISLDLRYNNLTGEIPQVGSLLNQGPTAFSNNPYLCGFPLQNACPENPKVPTTKQRQNPNRDLQTGEQNPRGGGLFVCVVAMVVISGILLCFAVVFMILRRGRCGDEGQFGKVEGGNVGCVDDVKGRFVVVEEEGGVLGGMELEDLLRGSAYVVGKSRSGIVYKVVGVGKGSSSAAGAANEFEAEVEGVARVRHPNVVALRAYYYAREEKLLVTDFVRNGNLHTALHGGPSNSFSPLPWAARLKIAQGAARGLTYIHEFSGRKYVHGNLKSTKILLDEDHSPYISGFGLTRLGIGSSNSKSLSSEPKRSNHSIATSAIVSIGSNVSTSSNIYLAPEARIAGGKFTQKCDVYSFGIVLLELLTGRLPDLGAENDGMGLESFVRKAFREEQPLSEIIDPALLPEVYAKKQVIAVFHVALNCTELDPELRPRMRTVSETLDRIKLQ